MALKQTPVSSNRTELSRQQMKQAIQLAVGAFWDAIDPSNSDSGVAEKFARNGSSSKNVTDFLALVDFKEKKLHHEKRISHQTLQEEFKTVFELPKYLRVKLGSHENAVFVQS
ncbi:MAG: hypothetical protein SGARI_007931 [Bacillariaceae sp.]